MENTEPFGRLYRTDKYAVPAAARDEFLENAQATHTFLKTQPGFIQGFILEQADGPSEFNFVNFTEFEDSQALANAREAVTALHERKGFDPRAFQERLGIRADVGIYKQPISGQ